MYEFEPAGYRAVALSHPVRMRRPDALPDTHFWILHHMRRGPLQARTVSVIARGLDARTAMRPLIEAGHVVQRATPSGRPFWSQTPAGRAALAQDKAAKAAWAADPRTRRHARDRDLMGARHG